MAKSPTLWVLFADGARARVLIPDATAGRFRTTLPLGRAEHPHAPPSARDADDSRSFTAELGARLNQEALRGAFDRLVLVGPGHLLHDLQMRLNKRAGGCVIGTVMSDDNGLNDAELSLHLARWWLAPAVSA